MNIDVIEFAFDELRYPLMIFSVTFRNCLKLLKISKWLFRRR